MKKFIKSNKHCNKKSVKTSTCSNKKSVKAAESYGWVVDENEAWEAYDFACEYFGKDELDAEIVQNLSVDELASSLAFIFRMNDFREWVERNNDEDIEESTNIRGKKSVTCAVGDSYIDQNARFELFDGFKVDVWEDNDSDVYDPIVLVMDEPWNYNGDFTGCTYTKGLNRCSHGPVSYEFLEESAHLVDEATARKVIIDYVDSSKTEDPDFYEAVYDEFKSDPYGD